MGVYRERVVDSELVRRLTSAGAMLIEGPKACGKTMTATRLARTSFRLDENESARLAVTLAPDQLFDNPTPILFDEWQIEPRIWNLVRRQVDDRQTPGLYILTGSATPYDDVRRHSGAGRFGVLRMRPMSLKESGHSTGAISLAGLFALQPQSGDGRHVTFQDLMERIMVGGWPALIGATETTARDWLADYLAQIIQVDVPALGARRNPRGLRRMLASLARHQGQAVKATELAKDVGGSDGPAAPETIRSYLDALERLHLIDDSDAWAPHMRSATRLRVAPVRYLVDPSLAAAALGIGSRQLADDVRALGFYFEALVIRDLRIYAQSLGGRVYSWRDANGNEVDAIVELADGRWAAIEVKLNPSAVDAGAVALLRLSERVDTNRHGAPTFTAVVTSTGFGGRRQDGVYVIPIGAFGP